MKNTESSLLGEASIERRPSSMDSIVCFFFIKNSKISEITLTLSFPSSLKL